MRISSRPAYDDDLDDVVRLVEAAIEEKLPQRGGRLWSTVGAPEPPISAAVEASMGAADEMIGVGMIDDVVLGFSAVRLLSLHDDTTIGELHLIYVDPDARGVGVGESLLREVINWSEEQGCVGIDSHALPGDRETKNFFESFGMVARQIVVHRRL